MSSIELIDHVRRLEAEVSRLKTELDAALNSVKTRLAGKVALVTGDFLRELYSVFHTVSIINSRVSFLVEAHCCSWVVVQVRGAGLGKR